MHLTQPIYLHEDMMEIVISEVIEPTIQGLINEKSIIMVLSISDWSMSMVNEKVIDSISRGLGYWYRKRYAEIE